MVKGSVICMVDGYELMELIKARIAELPAGYISKKTIKGKTQYYRQWREDGKMKSKYIRQADLEQLTEQIKERKRFEKKLKELQKKYPEKKGSAMKYKTNIKKGVELQTIAKMTRPYQKRDCFDRLQKYLQDEKNWTRVCAVFGLRRTGKTTMLMQAIDAMTKEEQAKTVYIKMRTTDVMNDLVHDLQLLWEKGYRYAFVDEITLMEDFIDSAALLSDLYVPMGMRIVLSGTDSLGFRFAEGNELYDRVRMIHTTFIPFREYSRLLGIDSIDEYIRYGGTLLPGEVDFDNPDVMADDASFRDDETTRKYVDTAISKNIQHSLACFEYGRHFGSLIDLYEANELTGAINRIVEDMNHRFVVSVLTKNFVSNDLGIASYNLKHERNREKRMELFDTIDRNSVTAKLMELLDIRNRSEQTVEITPVQASRIKEYLEALDLTAEYTVYGNNSKPDGEERVIFTQPGMRYCQAQALVYSLMRDETFELLPGEAKDFVTERILAEVRGRMLEDMILLEAMKALGRNYEVFKFRATQGEYDMVIYSKKERSCAAFEIKHSTQRVPEQSRHLRSDEMVSLITPRFGKLAGRFVLYLGEDYDGEDGIAYRNAEQFLKNLPEISLESGLEQSPDEDESSGIRPTM